MPLFRSGQAEILLASCHENPQISIGDRTDFWDSLPSKNAALLECCTLDKVTPSWIGWCPTMRREKSQSKFCRHSLLPVRLRIEVSLYLFLLICLHWSLFFCKAFSKTLSQSIMVSSTVLDPFHSHNPLYELNNLEEPWGAYQDF